MWFLKSRAGKMTHLVKVIAANLKDLSLIPETLTVKREPTPERCPVTFTHIKALSTTTHQKKSF